MLLIKTHINTYQVAETTESINDCTYDLSPLVLSGVFISVSYSHFLSSFCPWFLFYMQHDIPCILFPLCSTSKPAHTVKAKPTTKLRTRSSRPLSGPQGALNSPSFLLHNFIQSITRGHRHRRYCCRFLLNPWRHFYTFKTSQAAWAKVHHCQCKFRKKTLELLVVLLLTRTLKVGTFLPCWLLPSQFCHCHRSWKLSLWSGNNIHVI